MHPGMHTIPTHPALAPPHHQHHPAPPLLTPLPSPPALQSSQLAIRYTAQLFAIPLATGFIISHALAGPILDFILEKNPEAFAMTEHQVRRQGWW